MSSPTVSTESATRVRQPLVFGGIPEAEGFARAPITPRDRVHFRVDRELPLDEFRADLPDRVVWVPMRTPDAAVRRDLAVLPGDVVRLSGSTS